jgi:hypothetical protein
MREIGWKKEGELCGCERMWRKRNGKCHKMGTKKEIQNIRIPSTILSSFLLPGADAVEMMPFFCCCQDR